MTEHVTFRPYKAALTQFGDLHTNFILPIRLAEPVLQAGDVYAVLVVTPLEGQRVEVPIGVNALKHLRGIVGTGLRVLRSETKDAAL